MEITLDYNFTVKLFKKLGGDNFINLFNYIYKCEFYTFSMDWILDKQYILKFKGENADLIVYWNN